MAVDMLTGCPREEVPLVATSAELRARRRVVWPSRYPQRPETPARFSPAYPPYSWATVTALARPDRPLSTIAPAYYGSYDFLIL